MNDKIIHGPWQCSRCKKIYESLDPQGMGMGQPGKEPEYICPDCIKIKDIEEAAEEF